MTIQIVKSKKESVCQICKMPIKVGVWKIRSIVSNHSESMCYECTKQLEYEMREEAEQEKEVNMIDADKLRLQILKSATCDHCGIEFEGEIVCMNCGKILFSFYLD